MLRGFKKGLRVIDYIANQPTKRQRRFLALAEFWAQYHTCDQGAVGAVIVRDKRVIASGYNGAPSGLANCDDVGHAMLGEHCRRTVHAESNAIAQVAKCRISVNGCDVYVTAFPCWDCAKLLAACGIKNVYFMREYNLEEWGFYKPLYEQLDMNFIRLELKQ